MQHINRKSPVHPGSAAPAAGVVGADSAAQLLTLQEAADALRIGRTKLYELISTGVLTTRYIGRRRVISTADLAEFIRSLPTEPAA